MAHRVAAHTAHAAGESSSGQGVVSVSQVRASRTGCPVCSRSMPLTITGAIRIHGPLSNRCAGSGMSLCSQGSLSSVRSPEDSETPPVAHYSSSELLFSSELRQSTRVLKRIPRAARHLAATKLASVLDDVSEKNDSSSWARLFKFGRRCLAQPRCGGQRQSLTSVVKRQLEDEADPSFQRDSCLPRLHSCDPMQYLAKRVSVKLEEGDYRGAVRIACSEDTIADITDETISSLREKHPGPHPESHIPSPPQPEEFVPLPAITEEEVASAICSFPRGSAGGPDGIRPQHLLDLTSASAELGGKNL